MAIGITNLGVSSGTTDAAPDRKQTIDAVSYTIDSWDPPDTGIVLLVIMNGQNTVTDTAIDALTGNGDSWVQIHTATFGSERRQTIYAAFGSALTTGTTVVNFGSDTQLFCYAWMCQITGADESGTVAGAFGLEESSSGTATSGSHNWSGSPANADSRPFYAVAHNANETVTAPGSLTQIDENTGAGPTMGVLTAWEDDGFTDPSDSFTWTTSTAFGILALEILAADAGQTPPYANVTLR